MKKMALAVAAILLMSSANLAVAKSHEVNIGVGVGIPMGNLGDLYNVGFGADASGLYKVNPNVLLGFGVAYFTFADKLGLDTSYNSLEFLGRGKFVLGTGGAKPYLLAGAGFASRSISSGGYSINGTDLMIQPGVGVQFGSGNVGFYLEAKYSIAVVSGGTVSYLPITAGVSF